MFTIEAYCGCGASFNIAAADSESLAAATCTYCGGFLYEGPTGSRDGSTVHVDDALAPGEVSVEAVSGPFPQTC